jgi:glycosyltransferase involved in cell wall biosynthesis
MTAPLRTLLIAEACNPAWTSVPLVGYNLARALSQRSDLRVTIATHVRNREALASSDLGRRADIHYIDNEWIARPIHRFARLLRGGDQLGWTIDTAMAWPSYVVFEWTIEKVLSARLKNGEFDLIHRITPVSPTAASPLAASTSVPMIVGPLNGGLAWPKEFPELIRREREWLVPFRGLYRWLPYHRSMYRHLAGVIVASRSTAAEVPPTFRGARLLHPENGVDPERFPIADAWTPPAGRFRFITAGRLVAYKGLSLTLEAIRRSAPLRRCELVVVGDGPERKAHEALIARHGLGDCVKLLGHLPQPALAAELRRSQAFVFPSLREFGGAVVLEAMASALPCIVVDYGGPGELVEDATGIKLPPKPRETLIASLQGAMETLADSPDRCRRMGEAAALAVRRSHVWSAKAERLAAFYRETLSFARQRVAGEAA